MDQSYLSVLNTKIIQLGSIHQTGITSLSECTALSLQDVTNPDEILKAICEQQRL